MSTVRDPTRETGSLRRTAFNAASVAFLIFLYLFSPFTQTFLGWFVDFEDNISHRIHEVTFGALFAMIFAGLLLQLRDPIRYRVGLLQAIIGAVSLSIVVTSTTGWEWPTLFYLLPLGLIAWLHPARRDLYRLKLRPRRSLVVLMLVITGPLIEAFVDEFVKAVDEVFFHQQHWGGMATYALVILILGYLAALRVDGWPVLAATTSIGVGLFGVLSLIYGFDASAAPALPAVLGVIWAVVFALYARTAAAEVPQPAVDPAELETGRPRYLRSIRVGAAAFAVFVVGNLGHSLANDFTEPNVPHAITSVSSAYCRSCHLTGEENAPVIDLTYHGDGGGFGMVCSNCHSLPEVSPRTGVSASDAGVLTPSRWDRSILSDTERQWLAVRLDLLATKGGP